MTAEGTRDENGQAVEETKAALRQLAGSTPPPEGVVDRATTAVDDLDAAAAFVDDVGVDGLALSVETVDDPAVRARGERALAAFRRFRAAAAGDLEAGGDLEAAGDPTAGDPTAGDPTTGDREAAGDLTPGYPTAGERDEDSRSVDGDGAAGHFHPGPGTDLRDGTEATTE